MQCEQFEKRWQQLLDERRSPGVDPQLVAHSVTCASCAAMLEGSESLLLGLADDDEHLDDDFAARTVALALSEPASASASRDWRPAGVGSDAGKTRLRRLKRLGSSRLLGLAAVAAAVLLVALTNAGRQASSPDASVPSVPSVRPMPLVRHDAVAPQALPAAESSSPLPRPADEPDASGNALSEPSHDLPRLIIEIAERFPKDQAAKALSDHMQRLDSAARPLARSVGTAITAIYRSVGKGQTLDQSAQAEQALLEVA